MDLYELDDRLANAKYHMMEIEGLKPKYQNRVRSIIIKIESLQMMIDAAENAGREVNAE